MLFIVYYGKYSDSTFDFIQKKIESLEADNKQNVRVIELMDFAEFLNLNDDQLDELKILDDLIKDSMTNLESLATLEEKSEDAINELKKAESYYLG